jgi:hypothetical protein
MAEMNVIVRASKQKSEGKDSEAATLPEKVAAHEVYLRCQSDDVLAARFHVHDTQANGEVTVIMSQHHHTYPLEHRHL